MSTELSATPETQAAIDAQNLRRTLAMFATGITVITGRSASGELAGLTVNSFNSVSLHPALVVWSLSRHVTARPVLEHCEHYAINVLAADQEHMSRHFAGRMADRFAGVDWFAGHNGAPLLPGCCAHFEVRQHSQHAGGDHIVFIGEVERCERFEKPPLVYFDSKYRQLESL